MGAVRREEMILLDTQSVIWLLSQPQQLSKLAVAAILEARTNGERLACSPISIYEIIYSSFKKRLSLHCSHGEFIAEMLRKIDLVPLTTQIAQCAAELPEPFHNDPIDRIITATAIVERCTLITSDQKIRQANLCKTIW
jgi:PIN domain nuclease of toxin-antitoxin system